MTVMRDECCLGVACWFGLGNHTVLWCKVPAFTGLQLLVPEETCEVV